MFSSALISDPYFYLIAVPAVLITGISKGGLAGGLGLLAVPMLSLIMPPLQAAGIMLPVLIFMDLIGIWAYRKDWDRPSLVILVIGAAIGILIGTLSAGLLEEHHLKLIIGGVAVLFTVDHWWNKRAQEAPRPHNPTKATFWGAVGGFTSFIAHAGSPPFQVYMLPRRFSPRIYVGTSVVFFTLVNLIKLPPYFILGQLAPANLEAAFVLLPVAGIGIVSGIWLQSRIPREPFYRICYSLAFIVGVKLIWDGVTPWVMPLFA